MIDENRKKVAKSNFDRYLQQGLLTRERNDVAKENYLRNAELTLQVAEELSKSSLKPYMWVIVCSYYSMFYVANAVLTSLGYKTQDKIAHKVTNEALIVLVLYRLKNELVENYEAAQKDALDLAAVKAEDIIENYERELGKRSTFQYNMLEQTKESKATTSLQRAKEFVFEMKKLL